MFKRIIALLLCATLTLACVSSALGETCYCFLKSFFSDSENSSYLGGAPVTVDYDDDGGYCMFVYDVEEKEIRLSGANSSGKPEIAVWFDVDGSDGLIAIYGICGAWDTLADALDSGYSLAVGLDMGED